MIVMMRKAHDAHTTRLLSNQAGPRSAEARESEERPEEEEVGKLLVGRCSSWRGRELLR